MSGNRRHSPTDESGKNRAGTRTSSNSLHGVHEHRWNSPMKLVRRGAKLPQKYHYQPPSTASSPIPTIADPLVLWNEYQQQQINLSTQQSQQQQGSSKGGFGKGLDPPRAATSMGIRESGTAPTGARSTSSLLTAGAHQNAVGLRKSQTSQSTLFDLSMSLKIAQRMRYEVGLDLSGELPPPTRFTPSRQALAASRPAHEVDASSWESNVEGTVPSISATGENFEVIESDPYNLTGTTPGLWRLNGGDDGEPLSIGGALNAHRSLTPQPLGALHRPMTVNDAVRPMTRAQGGHPAVETMSDHLLQQAIGDPSLHYPRASSPIKQTDWRTLKQACEAKEPSPAGKVGTVSEEQLAEGFTKVALPNLRRLPSASDLPKRWSDVQKQSAVASPGLGKPPVGGIVVGGPSAVASHSTPQQHALHPLTRGDKSENLTVMQPPAREGRRRSREFSTPNALSLEPPAAPLATILDAAAKRVAPVDFSFPTLTKMKQLVRPATQGSHSRSQEPGTRYQPTTNVAKVLTTSHSREELKEDPTDLTALCLRVSNATISVSAIRPS